MAKIEVVFEGSVDGEGSGVEAAVSELQREAGIDVQAALTLSMGNRQDKTSFERLKGILLAALNSAQITRAKGTVVEEDAETKALARDSVDFFQDKVSYTVEVDPHGGTLTPESINSAFDRAITKFRKEQLHNR